MLDKLNKYIKSGEIQVEINNVGQAWHAKLKYNQGEDVKTFLSLSFSGAIEMLVDYLDKLNLTIKGD